MRLSRFAQSRTAKRQRQDGSLAHLRRSAEPGRLPLSRASGSPG
jgi:hypothetical protein